MLSVSAFSFLLGPILEPATRYVVFEEIDDDILPPLDSINFFNSSLEKIAKTPDITKDFPTKIDETFLFESSISN